MKYSVMISVFIGLSLSSSAVTENLICPPGLVSRESAIFEQTCYYTDKGKSYKSWQESLESCQSQGATLLEIYNEDIETFISTQFPVLSQILWLGAREKGDTVVWISGAPFSYTNWPLGLGGYTLESLVSLFGREELCIRTNDLLSSDPVWTRSRCFYKQPYICQIAAVAAEEAKQMSRKKKQKPKVPRSKRKSKKKMFLLDSSSGLAHPEVRADPVFRAHVSSSTLCARMCEADQLCVMFNFNLSFGECRAFRDKSGLASIVNSQGWKLWTLHHV